MLSSGCDTLYIRTVWNANQQSAVASVLNHLCVLELFSVICIPVSVCSINRLSSRRPTFFWSQGAFPLYGMVPLCVITVTHTLIYTHALSQPTVIISLIITYAQTPLVSVYCGFVVKQVHNNPQQIEQLEFELYSTRVSAASCIAQ